MLHLAVESVLVLKKFSFPGIDERQISTLTFLSFNVMSFYLHYIRIYFLEVSDDLIF